MHHDSTPAIRGQDGHLGPCGEDSPSRPAAVPAGARAAIARAIAHRARAIRDAEDAARAAWHDPSLNRWHRLAEADRVAADRALVAAILATAPEGEHVDPIDRLPARAIIQDGFAWLVVPDPRRAEDDGGGDNDPIMVLSASDLGLVVLDLDAGVEAAPVAAMTPPADVLTAEERSLLGHVRALGIADARQRLFLAGRYQATYDRLARGERPTEDDEGPAGDVVARAFAILDAVQPEGAEMAANGGKFADPDDANTIREVAQAARLARVILTGGPDRRARLAAG